MDHGELPEGLVLQRTTQEFDLASVPAALLRSHRIAAGVWGVLRVRAGSLDFVWEDANNSVATVELGPGESIVVPPEVPHRVVPGDLARFVVEFHR